MARVVARVEGLGPLEPLLADPDVTEVMVNAGRDVWVERSGRLEPAGVALADGQADQLIERIVAPLGLRIDRTAPIVDARLGDGSRVHAVVAPLAIDGTCLCIRRFAARAWPLAAFASDEVVALLGWAVEARCNVVVSGATSSGKTSLLNALAGAVPRRERIITIEDAAELRLPGDHVVRLESRPATAEGVGAVTTRQLLRAALRMRPDRLVVGEVRGAEALDMVQALNTGHDGSLATCHANSAVGRPRGGSSRWSWRARPPCPWSPSGSTCTAPSISSCTPPGPAAASGRSWRWPRSTPIPSAASARWSSPAGSSPSPDGGEVPHHGPADHRRCARPRAGGGVGLARPVSATRRAAARRRLAELRAPPGQPATPGAVMAAVRRRWRGRVGAAAGEGHGLPGVLEDVARGVRAGSSLRQACADAATAAGPSAGAPGWRRRWPRPTAARPSPPPWPVGPWSAPRPTNGSPPARWPSPRTAGGPQARAVDGVAATLRERRAVVAEIRAQSAQARLSAVVIGALPLLFLLWAVATDRRTAAFLVAGPAGWACLGAGVGLEVVGGLWMRRLLRGAAP